MATLFERWWVAAFVAALAVFGFGQLQAWPFTSWYMFSHVEPSTISVARAVAVSEDGHERILSADVLPLGLQSHRLLERVQQDRAGVCRAVFEGARESGIDARSVRIERLTWRVLDRSGDRPAHVNVVVIETCT